MNTTDVQSVVHTQRPLEGLLVVGKPMSDKGFAGFATFDLQKSVDELLVRIVSQKLSAQSHLDDEPSVVSQFLTVAP